ncbi:MAG: hypothetical protein JRN21_02810 [Nitrososphaerota archaeon]|nr:hypothetical protein [Nitrososphaerota archaeon]
MTRRSGTPVGQQSLEREVGRHPGRAGARTRREESEFGAHPRRVEDAQLKRIASGMKRFLPQSQRLKKAGVTRVRATGSGVEVSGFLFTSCVVEGKKFVVDFTARTAPDGSVVSATINGKPAYSRASCT